MKIFENIEFDFERTKEFINLVKKWGIDENKILNFFDDLIDDDVVFQQKQGIIKYEDDENKFEIVILLYFEYTFDKIEYNINNGYLYNFSDYKRFIEKQNQIFSDIQRSVKIFTEAERLIISNRGTGISKIPFYMLQDGRNSKLMVEYKLISKIESSDVSIEYKKFKNMENPIGDYRDNLVSELVEEGIVPEFAEILIDVDPGYKESDFVFFGFMTNDEIILIATYDNEEKKSKIDIIEFNRAIELFYDGYCSDILGEGYLDRN
jgi:hypothetical protein